MATITVRALDPVTWEPQNGNGLANFLSDNAAVAQIICTRLKLFEGEWFLNLQDGLPLFQSMLGAFASQKQLQIISNLISARINGTIYVSGIQSMVTSYKDRKFTFTAVVTTQFGIVTVTNSPGSLIAIASASS
jgi:hypothetical protein